MILCAPTVNDEMEDDAAVPLLRVTGEPRLVTPSLNCTVPVGVPELGIDVETTALNVTGCPEVERFMEDERPVELSSLFTVCMNEELVLLVKLVSPL